MSPGPKILIVDDEPAILMALTLAFESEPWRITTAANAERALDLVASSAFDCYLVDKNLPGRSGIELIREVRRRDPAAGVVVMTGYGTVDSALDALGLGVDAYLEKPFRDIFELVPIVKKAVATAEARRQRHRKPPPRIDTSGLPGLRVLLASPSQPQRAAIRLALREVDELRYAATPAQARAIAVEHDAELAIVDAAGWDTPGVVESLREACPAIRVIIVGPKLGIVAIRRLIELEVKGFFHAGLGTPEFGAMVEPILDMIRLNKLEALEATEALLQTPADR